MKREGGKPYRFEHVNMVWDEKLPHCAKMIIEAGSYSFFEKIQGYDVEVIEQFVRNFNGADSQRLILEPLISKSRKNLLQYQWDAYRGRKVL